MHVTMIVKIVACGGRADSSWRPGAGGRDRRRRPMILSAASQIA